jgi:hypothetical protein
MPTTVYNPHQHEEVHTAPYTYVYVGIYVLCVNVR